MNPIVQAKALLAAGRLGEASAIAGTVLRTNPSDSEALRIVAIVQFQSGYRKEGVKLAERAVQVAPNNAEALNALGLMRHMLGQPDAAIQAFQRATAADPGLQEGWRNLGFVLQGAGNHEEALRAFDRAGRTAGVSFFRGNSLAALGKHAEAIAEFERVIAAEPANGDAWLNRGNSLVALGNPAEAVESIKTGLKNAGQAPIPHCSLAVALLKAGRPYEAMAIVDQVLKWDSECERAHEVKELIAAGIEAVEAESAEIIALGERSPEAIDKRAQLARALQTQGKWSEVHASLSGAADPGLRFLDALLLPAIFESKDMADDALGRLTRKVGRLREDDLKLEDPLRQVGVTMFHLPYFGVSERSYQEQIAGLYLSAAPSLSFASSHSPREGRQRLGVLSAHLTDHTVSRVFGGLIERLDRSRFEVVYLQIGKGDASSEKLAASVDRHVYVPATLTEARDQVARAELDMLFYPEIGMDPLCYYLSYSRLAPVQFTTWGHPLTTGSPAMDHFVSSVHLEREDGQTEYSEKLTTLPSLTTFYSRPQSPLEWSRADFGLPEGRNLYGCPQMPYKFHPDYDRVLAEILARDPLGHLVLVEPQRPYFKQVLIERWQRSYPVLLERVIWLHLMPLDRFLRLLQLCDALLAPIHFGAGRSTLDALGVGAPVVTYKGKFLKSRITYAAYREIDLNDLIAESEEGYIEMANRLATDQDWQKAMRRAVSEKAGRLFESAAAVRELNEFLAGIAPGVA